jgi:hypothetical protein
LTCLLVGAASGALCTAGVDAGGLDVEFSILVGFSLSLPSFLGLVFGGAWRVAFLLDKTSKGFLLLIIYSGIPKVEPRLADH